MVAQTYDEAMRRVFADEGGYCNDAADPGGPTKYGITIFDVRKYLKANATAEDVKTLTQAEAMEIYRQHYANPCRYVYLPAGVDYTILDYGINSGIGRSGKVLRRVLGLPDNTSLITNDVLTAVAKRDPKAIVTAINDERLRFLQSLKIWPNFGKGWGRRVAGVKTTSLRMAGAAVAPTPAPLTVPPAAAGKGTVPESKAVKNVVKGSGPGVIVEEAGRDGASWWDWIAAHPKVSVVLAIAAAAVVVFVIAAINRWHKNKSETPMPDTQVVPELPLSLQTSP